MYQKKLTDVKIEMQDIENRKQEEEIQHEYNMKVSTDRI